MKKIIVEEPSFEKVEIGTRPVEKWQTSDGEIHNSEYDAVRHEFRKCKLKERHVFIEEGSNANIIDIDNYHDLKQYINDCLGRDYSDVEISEDITFPNKLVIYSITIIDEDDYYNDFEQYYITTIERYKEILFKEIDNQVN